MANEMQGARDEVAATPPIRPPTMDPERQLPAEAEAAHTVPDYDDPERARADIEATRARMSGTIDELEDALVRKKEEIQNRFDFIAPVRENPWPSMGIALGAGLLLGLLTGGDDEDDELEDHHVSRLHAGPGAAEWEHRADILEERTRRLLAIAREQETEIRRLRGKKKKRRDKPSLSERVVDRVEDEYEHLSERAEEATSRLDDLRHSVMDGLASFLQDAFQEMKRRR